MFVGNDSQVKQPFVPPDLSLSLSSSFAFFSSLPFPSPLTFFLCYFLELRSLLREVSSPCDSFMTCCLLLESLNSLLSSYKTITLCFPWPSFFSPQNLPFIPMWFRITWALRILAVGLLVTVYLLSSVFTCPRGRLSFWTGFLGSLLHTGFRVTVSEGHPQVSSDVRSLHFSASHMLL